MSIVVKVYPAHSYLLSVGCTARRSGCLSILGGYEGESKRVETACLNTPVEDSGGSGSLAPYFEKHLQKQTNTRFKFGPKLTCNPFFEFFFQGCFTSIEIPLN